MGSTNGREILRRLPMLMQNFVDRSSFVEPNFLRRRDESQMATKFSRRVFPTEFVKTTRAERLRTCFFHRRRVEISRSNRFDLLRIRRQGLKIFSFLFRFVFVNFLIEIVQQTFLVIGRQGVRTGRGTRLLHQKSIEQNVLKTLIQLFQFAFVKGVQNRHAQLHTLDRRQEDQRVRIATARFASMALRLDERGHFRREIVLKLIDDRR